MSDGSGVRCEIIHNLIGHHKRNHAYTYNYSEHGRHTTPHALATPTATAAAATTVAIAGDSNAFSVAAMTPDGAVLVDAALEEDPAGGLLLVFAFFFFFSMATTHVSECHGAARKHILTD